jgi:hypothetical protein
MWEKTFGAKTSNFHMNAFKKRSNANCYYSPGVDRFFAVDTLDPYTSLEVAQLLSGKMPGIAVCVLSVNDAFMLNENCHEYTLQEKQVFALGASILFSRQIPAIRRFGEQSVRHVGPEMPPDYRNNENFEVFMKFKQYAQFVIQAWHAAKTCDMQFNFMPMEQYADDYFDVLNPGFETPADNVNGELRSGITKEIKKILYFSSSHEEALEKIAQMWRENNTPLSVYWRAQFYNLLEIDPPADLVNSEVNIDRYSGYLL